MGIGFEAITGLLSPIFKIIDKAVPDATEANRLKSQIEQSMIDLQTKTQENAKEIALKEISGTKFQAYWRPTLAWMVVIMWPYNYVVRPISVQISGVDLPEVPESALATITTVFSSVYSLGRTFEKTGSKIELGRKK